MVKKDKKKKLKKLWFFLFPGALILAISLVLISSGRYLRQKPCGCKPLAENFSGEFEAKENQAFYNNQPVAYPLAQLRPESLAGLPAEESVLGMTSERRWIEVDLSKQKLYAHNGNRIDYEFLISSGKPWTPTVTGNFRVWVKLRYAKMSGGSRENGDYYYLPNVPYIQYFYKDYGLHGAYWHHNFGQTMSHGCVNLSVADAKKLFDWTSPPVGFGQWVAYPSKDHPGTRVVIHK